jgi:hypothetical protein
MHPPLAQIAAMCCIAQWLGLDLTTGKGKVNLSDSKMRPLEIFMCSVVKRQGYGEGFRWVAQVRALPTRSHIIATHHAGSRMPPPLASHCQPPQYIK